MIEELRKAREESSNVAYMHFISLTKKGIDGYFCFFEGKDAPYYLPRIKTIFSGNVHPIICCGKSKVLKVHELIHNHQEYWKYRKGFFIDLDFDESVKAKYHPPIYETPTYSIENFYCTKDTFSDILKSEFGLVEHEKEYGDSMKIFIERQKEFHESTITFNAWYYCLKMLKKERNLNSTNVSLENKMPTNFLIASIDQISANYDLDRIKDVFPKAIRWSKRRVLDYVKVLRSQCLSDCLRGKFEIQFLDIILRGLIQDANDKSKRRVLKRKTNFNYDFSRIISQLSQYAKTPDCLYGYVTETCSKIYKKTA